MSFKSLRWYRYHRSLKKPLTMMGQTLTKREGLLLKGMLANEEVLWSEAAPLPGLHTESLEEVFQLRGEIGRALFECDMQELQPAALNEKGWPVTARFAAQALWLQLQARHRGIPLRRLLNPNAEEIVALNALVTLPVSRVKLQDMSAYFSDIKIKVGRDDPREEADAINALAPLPGRLSLRLDANRAWSMEDALLFADQLDVPVGYIEEPLQKDQNLETFYNKSGLRYALDESLPGRQPDMLKKLHGCAALVLKPSLHGMFDTMLWSAAAAESGMGVVISSVFESAIGLNILAHLGAAYSKNSSCGLDTARFFKTDLCDLDRPRPGIIRPQSNILPNMTMLREVK